EPQFFFDEAKGFSLHVSPRYAESLSLARILADELMGIGLRFTTLHEPSNPAGARVPFLDSVRGIYLRDKLAVLNNTEMPAVLLEAGLIVNRDEELVVSTAAYQKSLLQLSQKLCKSSVAASTHRIVNMAPDDVVNIRSEPTGPHQNIS